MTSRVGSSIRMRIGMLVFTGGLLLTVIPAHAQDAPSVRKNNVEIGGMVGSSFGFDSYRVMGGGNVGWAATRNIFPFFEMTYLPGLERRDTQTIPENECDADVCSYNVFYKAPATDFNGGIHLRFPISESRWVPYVVAGVGALRFGGTAELRDNNGQPISGDEIPTETVFSPNFGAGLRYYINEDWGVRVEFKGYKPVTGTAANQDPFYRVAFAVFYQIH